MLGLRRIVLLFLTLAMAAVACTSARAQSTPSSETPMVWPGADPGALEGAWTTGELTRTQIIENAVAQGASRRCARDFLGGTKHTLTWNLYLREGQWILYGQVDGAAAEDFEGGTYTRFLNGEEAMFTSLNPIVTDDYWMMSALVGDELMMDYISLTQWRPEGDGTPCFVKAATIIELTNPFTRIA